jgi:hypothetical protein
MRNVKKQFQIVMGYQRNGHFDFVLPSAENKDFHANCRLISAAPDLLESLKKANKYIAMKGEVSYPIFGLDAINKAEGK